MSKDLSSLVEDIYKLFAETTTVEIDQEALSTCLSTISEKIQQSLQRQKREEYLRVSKLGSKDRKLWFDLNTPNEQKEIDGPTAIKFLYGDILEAFLIFLIRQAGHSVTGEQGEVNINGVVGHRDCIVDGITVDIKSASGRQFPKFKDGSLFANDTFGYAAQLSGYAKADNSPYAAFIAINKESGELAVLKLDPVDMIDPYQRVDYLREEVLSKPTPPEQKCYEPIAMGKAGNEVLSPNCALYCRHRDTCWVETHLRKFKYSDGVKYFTKVVKEPDVEEIF